MNIIWGIIGFLITILLLVTIHEWGHFYVARKCGVKILRFSLGFGKPIITKIGKDGTKYTLSPIPLGGFVQMYGESEKEKIPESEKMRTFSGQPPFKRFLIACAGPAMNLIFAVLAFSLLFIIGVQGIRPEVAYVAPDSLAYQAGIRSGDILQNVDGHTIKLSQDARFALATAGHQPINVRYLRDGQTHTTQLNLSSLGAGDELRIAQATGLFLVEEYWPAIIKEVVEGSSAQKMGLQPYDEIVALNGQALFPDNAIASITQYARAHKNQQIRLGVKRKGQTLTLEGTLGERDDQKGNKIGFLGAVWDVQNAQTFEQRYGVVEHYGVLQSLGKGIQKTWNYVDKSYVMLGRLIIRQASIEQLGGPITIGDAAGRTLQMGWDVFFNFLGLVSLSLAVINLIPLPMLDGGHMLFCVIEGIRGKPLSECAMIWCYRVGATIVLSFMGFVLMYDFWRYLR